MRSVIHRICEMLWRSEFHDNDFIHKCRWPNRFHLQMKCIILPNFRDRNIDTKCRKCLCSVWRQLHTINQKAETACRPLHSETGSGSRSPEKRWFSTVHDHWDLRYFGQNLSLSTESMYLHISKHAPVHSLLNYKATENLQHKGLYFVAKYDL